MNGETKLAFVGFHGTGKTTYLGALWMVLQDPRDDTMSEVEIRGDRSHLQFIGEQVAKAERLTRTDVDSEEGFYVTLKFKDGPDLTLDVPDLSGEGVRILVEDRLWHSHLLDAVREADAILLFLSPTPFRLPIRSSFTDDLLTDFLVQTDDSESEELVDSRTQGEAGVGDALGEERARVPDVNAPIPAAADAEVQGPDRQPQVEIEFQTRLACTAARVIDALENVLALRSDDTGLRLGVVISAWDSVEPGLTPVGWLQQRLPAVASFLEVNSDRVTSEVFGVSAQGGRLPEQKAELLAKGAVLDRVFATGRDGDSIGFADPLRWAAGK